MAKAIQKENKHLDPVKTYKLTYQLYQAGGVERFYFFLLDLLEDFGYKTSKTQDSMIVSQGSSLWAAMSQRKGAAQEKAAQFMGTIGGMVRDIVKIIRELRITDERYEYYIKSKEGDESAEIALKGLWVDMVEGGLKSTTSIYYLAREVGFTILPDLFFRIHPKTSKDVDKDVDKLKEQGINKKVREVLKRKLQQYMIWKEKTDTEIKVRKRFLLKHLRQQYHSIQLYISWVKPYLRDINRIQGKDYIGDHKDIIMGAETAVIDLEIIATLKDDSKYIKYVPVIIIKIHNRVSPQLVYTTEYQRGPVHVGKSEFTFSAYIMTRKQVEIYLKKKEEEDLKVLSTINLAIDAMKDDIKKYLIEAGELEKEEKKEEPGIEKFFKPFSNSFKAKFEPFSRFKIPNFKKSPEEVEKDDYKIRKEKSEAKKFIGSQLWIIYDVFKKAHQMITW